MCPNVERFKIEVPQPVPDDLSERLGKIRWPDDPEEPEQFAWDLRETAETIGKGRVPAGRVSR